MIRVNFSSIITGISLVLAVILVIMLTFIALNKLSPLFPEKVTLNAKCEHTDGRKFISTNQPKSAYYWKMLISDDGWRYTVDKPGWRCKWSKYEEK